MAKTERKTGLGPRATERRRRLELRLVLVMQERYCRAHHQGQEDWPWQGRGYRLCPHCQEAARRLLRQTQHCRYMGQKTFCHNCPRPCHRPDEETRAMMRYSGPRLFLRHPGLGLAHLYYLLRARLSGAQGRRPEAKKE